MKAKLMRFGFKHRIQKRRWPLISQEVTSMDANIGNIEIWSCRTRSFRYYNFTTD